MIELIESAVMIASFSSYTHRDYVLKSNVTHGEARATVSSQVSLRMITQYARDI